jgi:hypothetical protein
VLRLALMALLVTEIVLGDSPDPCEQKVPAPLKTLLSSKFPGFHPARLSDQTADDIQVNKQSGGDGCITVAVGDFDGDGRPDIALLLTNPKSDAVHLVAALRRGASWAVYQLPTWCKSVSACYVKTEKPGRFRRSRSLDAPLSPPDERGQIESRTENVISGTVDATGIVYVYKQGEWQYVWVSD